VLKAAHGIAVLDGGPGLKCLLGLEPAVAAAAVRSLERAGLVADRIDDGGAGAPDAVALGPQAGHDLVELDELARVDLTDLRHGADPTPPGG